MVFPLYHQCTFQSSISTTWFFYTTTAPYCIHCHRWKASLYAKECKVITTVNSSNHMVVLPGSRWCNWEKRMYFRQSCRGHSEMVISSCQHLVGTFPPPSANWKSGTRLFNPVQRHPSPKSLFKQPESKPPKLCSKGSSLRESWCKTGGGKREQLSLLLMLHYGFVCVKEIKPFCLPTHSVLWLKY